MNNQLEFTALKFFNNLEW